MNKHLATLAIIAAACTPQLSAQTIISLDFRQNPLFEISTDNVTAALPGDGTPITLGADLTVKGGSGSYKYEWKNAAGTLLGESSSLTVDSPGSYVLTVSDQCECSHEVLFNVETSGIDAAMIPGVCITVSGSEIIIEGTEAVQASLFSPSGTMTSLLTPDAPTSRLSFADTTPGVYILQIVSTDNTVITKKIKLT